MGDIDIGATAADFADGHGVSVRWIQMLAKRQSIDAEKFKGRWMIDSGETLLDMPPGRPLSNNLALRVFCALAADGRDAQLNPPDKSCRHRVRKYVERASSTPMPAKLLRGWFRDFDVPRQLTIPSGALERFRTDPRVAATGASAPILRKFVDLRTFPFEVYVSTSRFPEIEQSYGLRALVGDAPRGRSIILVHVSAAGGFRLPTPGVVAVDLSRHPDAFLELIVRQLLQSHVASGASEIERRQSGHKVDR